MRATYSFPLILVCLMAWTNLGSAGDEPAGPEQSPKLADVVRELPFDIARSGRQKSGWCVTLCFTREQVEQELGREAGKAVWAKIDPGKELVAVIGLPDTFMDPALDKFTVREIKADGSVTLRFRYRDWHGPQFLIGFGRWPGRCKAYAVPRGAAVGLD